MSGTNSKGSAKQNSLDGTTKKVLRDLIREDKPVVDDATKLAIRDIIREEFESPPASLVKEIETEVRVRIRRQEWYYYFISVIIAVAVTYFFHVEFSKIPSAVDDALKADSSKITSEKISEIFSNAQTRDFQIELANSKFKVAAEVAQHGLDQMVALVQSNADQVNKLINAMPGMVDTNVATPYANRLAELSKKDNLLTTEDISKLFVRELVTNSVDRNTFVLTYEPIPESVKVYSGTTSGQFAYRAFPFDQFGISQGHSLIVTNQNPSFSSVVLDHAINGVFVEYIRKSLHDQ